MTGNKELTLMIFRNLYYILEKDQLDKGWKQTFHLLILQNLWGTWSLQSKELTLYDFLKSTRAWEKLTRKNGWKQYFHLLIKLCVLKLKRCF